MKAYSEDLRCRVVRATDDGLSQPDAARLFRVGLRTVERYLHQWRERGALTSRTSSGDRPAIPPGRYPVLVAHWQRSPHRTPSAGSPIAAISRHPANQHENRSNRI
ncbi:MAG: helix-turn-helix domain-containing protein [Thermomicrobia bacterium]|nr:helix-turn-helix domain-containing protein [Thermomicrobia bacterium]